MSFLANLRSQHTERHSLRLCYMLLPDAQKGKLQLFLRLHNSQQGPIHSAQDYLLQRDHLQQPPAFIRDDDLDILQAYNEVSTQWPIRELSLALPLDWPQLQAVVATGRCYCLQPYPFKIVSLGDERPAEPYWCLDQGAQYYLRWRLPAHDQALCLPLENDLYYQELLGEQVIIGRAVPQVSSSWPRQGYRALHQLGLSVASIRQQGCNTLSLPLPLPAPPPIEKGDTQVQWLLICHSDHQGRDWLHLHFSLGNERFCCLPQAFGDNVQLTTLCWNGDSLQQLEIDQEGFQRGYQGLCHVLDRALPGDHPPGQWQGQDDRQWQVLFTELRQSLQQLDAQFVVSKTFSHHYIAFAQWHVHLQQGALQQGLQLAIDIEVGGDSIPLQHIFSQLQQYNRQIQDKPFQIQLEDGRILLLPAAETSLLMEELADMHFDHQGFYLDRKQAYRLAQLNQQLDTQSQWSGDLTPLNQAIAIQQSPLVIDSDASFVQAELRPYQWLGICWIHHLKQQGVNGLLADDMGLGKTLQTIGLLAFEKQQGRLQQPALIVLPLSLLYNWVAELAKFAPQLRVHVVHGSKRHESGPNLQGLDVLLTTYQSAAIDLDYWQQQSLSWLILDEAQTIKNPNTRWSQALRNIDSDHRLCLSGTPVENHLGELWSIMDFLMPGCLGRQKDFQRHFRQPIEKEGDHSRLLQLLKRVAPFMLRRTKDQIATDLPAKTEIVQRIPLAAEQREFYDHLKNQTQAALREQAQESDRNQSMDVLSALMKLRQACCAPSLCGAANVPSAKKEYCLTMLAELVEEGRAVLVFSQFTEMLHELQTALSALQINSLMLTGKSRNRQDLVDRFQQGEAPVFLISLKAGGTGLNLTRADTVIHYDPWWNAAAEKQASDRAHRIGQDKPVFIYKLIAAETIEDKIAQLQQQKAFLSQHIDQQAVNTAGQFSLKLEELLSLLQEETPAT